MNEIHELARDLGQVPGKLVRNVEKVIPKTGLEMKKRMQKDFRDSKHFWKIGNSVSYEVTKLAESVSVEIGVEMGRGDSAGLNHIAYFGSSKAGGGTVPDPVVPMRLEAPKFFGFMEMAAEGLL